jgi:hypothetical protein
MPRSGVVGCPQQGVADPACLWLAGEPVLVAVEAASDRELGGRFAAGLDVAAVDSDGRRAREPSLFGRCLVGDQDGVELGLDAELVPARSTSASAPG